MGREIELKSCPGCDWDKPIYAFAAGEEECKSCVRRKKTVDPSKYTPLEYGLFTELNEIEGVLAEALGYPYDEDYGWVVGDHTQLTLADEAAREIKQLRKSLHLINEVLQGRKGL
jgi:hypothetical protein